MAWSKSVLQTPVAPRPAYYSEETENDGDKTLAASDYGDGSRLLITGIRIEYTADANAATRKPTLEVKDSAGDVLFSLELSSNSNVTATNTATIECMVGATSAAAVGGITPEFIPEGLWLANSASLRVYAVDAQAGDDMTVHVRGLLH